MSILDFIKSVFGGEPKEEAAQSECVVKEKPINSDICVDKTPTLENVARYVIQTRNSKVTDIQSYFQIGYKLAGSLMSQLQQNGLLDNACNVLIDANISDQELAQLLSNEMPKAAGSHHAASASGFEVKIISSSPIDTQTSV